MQSLPDFYAFMITGMQLCSFCNRHTINSGHNQFVQTGFKLYTKTGLFLGTKEMEGFDIAYQHKCYRGNVMRSPSKA